jgi:hypothetical protein
MLRMVRPIFAALCLLVGGAMAPAHAAEPRADFARARCAVGVDWLVNPADNICGLRDPKMLSNPVRVDFDSLLQATTEFEKMRRENIGSNSPEGIQLRQAAIDRVRRACEAVRVANGHCSVWKAIRHRDDRPVVDVTELVRGRL